MIHFSRLDLIRHLRERTARIAAPGRAVRGDGPRGEAGAVGRLILGPGLEPGTLVEWVSGGEGCGAVTLALAVAARVLGRGGACVLVDPAGEFYPPALARLGVPPERTVIVRPPSPRDGLWAWEQALRCPGVAVALGPVAGLTDRHYYRLQLAAEAGGGLGFLLRPPALCDAPSRAAVRLRVSARPGPGPPEPPSRRLNVELLHCRGTAAGATAELELDHETGDVRLVSQLADPALPPRVAAGEPAVA